MVIRDEVRRLPAYRFKHHRQPVKLDQNEAPDDLDGGLALAIAERIAGIALNRYPDLHPVDLERAIAERNGWEPEGVVVANGSNVLIQALVIASGLGRTVLTLTPTFSVYAAQARLLGTELVEVPLTSGFDMPAGEMIAALEGRSGVAFVADPAAPTGGRLDRNAVERFARAADATGRWLTVLDEAYVEFTAEDHANLVHELPNAAVMRTFSKAAGLAAARLGYLLLDPALAAEVRKALLPFCVSALQATAGIVALEHEDLMRERVDTAVAERGRLAEELSGMPGVEVIPSVTNFVLFRVADPAAVHEALLAGGVVIRRQDHLPGLEGCLRVTAGHRYENDAFLEAMRAITGREVVSHV